MAANRASLVSYADSDTTYHSFNDIELYAPSSPPTTQVKDQSDVQVKQVKGEEAPKRIRHIDKRPTTAVNLQRQDSGYESYGSTPRASISGPRPSISESRPSISRRETLSLAQVYGPSSSSRPRSRPFTRRGNKSFSHQIHGSTNNLVSGTTSPPLYQARPHSVQVNQPASYFHFPSPDPVDVGSGAPSSSMAHLPGHRDRQPQTYSPAPSSAIPSLPPQPQHYWTSDRTRRLEYATIDAASRGFKGWVRRNLVPECFVPRANRHVPFDEDSGSVRRYRLELEDDPQSVVGLGEKAHGVRSGEVNGRGKKGWPF